MTVPVAATDAVVSGVSDQDIDRLANVLCRLYLAR